jgi:hypothetical protein
MEAYDIHGTNEILRSWWNEDRRPRMMTFFSRKNPKLDSWFFWYYLLHGNQGVIAWPEGWFRAGGEEIAPHIKALKETFDEIQGPISEILVDPNTQCSSDPIGIYYSHPSVQVGWSMDAITHGKTWIKRLGSIDNENQSQGVLRKVWCKTLEDLGYQYDFISYLDVKEGRIDLNNKFKVIVLPKTICLSEREAEVFNEFVKKGGTLIADYLCGLTDEHGKGRRKGALDDLFGISRDEDRGYLDGDGLTELDAEKYKRPFLDRFTYYDGAKRYNGIVIFERGTKKAPDTSAIEIKSRFGLFHQVSVLFEKKTGEGKTAYLNLTPLEYWAPSRRFSEYGYEWRKIISQILKSAGLEPRVRIYERGNLENMIEALFWRNDGNFYLGLIKNPTDKKELKRIDGMYPIEGITGDEVEIQLEFNRPVGLQNLRTNQHIGAGTVFRDRFRPWEGNLYRVKYIE